MVYQPLVSHAELTINGGLWTVYDEVQKVPVRLRVLASSSSTDTPMMGVQRL